MGKVNLEINGRKFTLGCDDGEEERLLGLGQKLDNRIKDLANQFGQIGDLRLLVMAGITMTDELEEAREGLEGQAEEMSEKMLKKSKKDLESAQHTLETAQHSEASAADALADAARRIERLAATLTSS